MSKLPVPDLSRPTHSRRFIIQTLTAAGGGLIVGCKPLEWSDDVPVASQFSMLLRIHSDNRVVIVPPAAEMGQDIFTSQAAILADELDVDWRAVEIDIAPFHSDFAGRRGQATGGSDSIRQWYLPLRRLGAAARLVLIQAAAKQLDCPIASLTTQSGFVLHEASGRKRSYGSLAMDAADLPLEDEPPLKADASLRLIGKSLGRKDSASKTDGTAIFGADVRLAEQLYAAVSMPPAFAGELIAYDESAAARMTDIVGVYRLGNAVAVVSDSWWRSKQALQELAIEFHPGSVAGLNDALIDTKYQEALHGDGGAIASKSGDPQLALAHATVHEASYQVPYVAHVCMEPMTATVSVEADRVIAYAPTQSPERFAKRVAELCGRPLSDVQMNNTFLGGGFGRKGLDTVALDQATELSLQLNRPVQVIWDRETDIAHDQYRPAAQYWFRASLNQNQELDAVDLRVATQSLRRARFPEFVQPGMFEIGNDFFVYKTKVHQHVWSEVQLPVNVGFWRAVGHSADPFAVESFVDELAEQAFLDPVAFRLAHLEDKPRIAAVLKKAAAESGWGRKLGSGRGLGIAVQEGWDSVCAQVIEVAVKGGQLSIEKMWVVADCGKVISPDTVRAQLVGGALFALDAALGGKVSFERGASVARNFDAYPLLGISDVPPVEVVIMKSQLPPGGVGELGVPACAPALANALFAATGRRYRDLPLSQHAPFTVKRPS